MESQKEEVILSINIKILVSLVRLSSWAGTMLGTGWQGRGCCRENVGGLEPWREMRDCLESCLRWGRELMALVSTGCR